MNLEQLIEREDEAIGLYFCYDCGKVISEQVMLKYSTGDGYHLCIEDGKRDLESNITEEERAVLENRVVLGIAKEFTIGQMAELLLKGTEGIALWRDTDLVTEYRRLYGTEWPTHVE